MADPKKEDVKTSTKEGKTASSKKEDGTRHGTDPAPAAQPTAGAHGKAGDEPVRGVLHDMGPEVEPLEDDDSGTKKKDSKG